MAAPVVADCPKLRYLDKVTILTGGTKGIGEGILRVFVQNGSKVLFCSNEDDIGPNLEKELNGRGPGECQFILCDMTQEDQIKKLISAAVAKYGKIDCLINNAGTHCGHRNIEDHTAEDFMALWRLNVLGPFLAIKYALPYLRKTRGNIINTSSMVAHLGQNQAAPYCATKGAIISMTRSLAIDEGKHGVRVNSVSPSNVFTPLWEKQARKYMDMKDGEEMKRFGGSLQVLGRMGTYEEVGLTYLYLAADATFNTGMDIPFSGGSELGYSVKTDDVFAPGK